MRNLLIIASIVCVSIILIFFLFSQSFEKFLPVSNLPDYQKNLISNDVLGYQIRKGGNEVIFLTSDRKNINVYSFNSTRDYLKKLNTSDIPVEITVNNNLLGFSPSFVDQNNNIFFKFGPLIQISPDNNIKIYHEFSLRSNEIIINPKATLGSIYDYKLPPIDTVGISLLETDKPYKINTSPPANLRYVCYFQITFGDGIPCRGYRLLLNIGQKKVVLPNFKEGEETSKYDSPFVYVPYDKNYFMTDKSFIFLSQTNKLYEFK